MAKQTAMLRPVVEKLGLTVREVAAIASLDQTSIYKAIRERRLRIRKYRTWAIITRADLASFLESLPDGPETPEAQSARPDQFEEAIFKRPSSV